MSKRRQWRWSINLSKPIRAQACSRSGFGHCLPIFLILLTLSVPLAGCRDLAGQAGDQQGELIVFAAASLAEAFTEMGRQFEAANPGTEVILNLAGSQQLAHQLSQGAPADVFASADERQMAAAISAGRVENGDQQVFARNHLVVAYPAGNPAHLRQLADLAQPGLRIILAAAEVPAGRYAQLFLDQAAQDPALGPDFRERVINNVVSYEENVRAVLSKVILSEADAGIIYASDVDQDTDDRLGWIEIPDALNPMASYPIAALNDSRNLALSHSFVRFVLSPEGQEILVEHGFLPAEMQR